MGDDEVGLVNRQIIDEEDIGIEGAGAPTHRAHPVGRFLQGLTAAQEFPGGVRRLQLDNDVEEGPLVLGPADRFGLIERRDGDDIARRLPDLPLLGAGWPPDRRGWTRAR